MKRSIVSKLVYVSLFAIATSFLHAQTEAESEAPVKEETAENNAYYALDNNGVYARDSSGNRIRFGSPRDTSPTAIKHINREKNYIEIEKDDIRLALNGDEGTFAIYGVAEKGNHIPLLTTKDGNCKSYFIVKSGTHEYKLQSKAGIKTEVRNTPLGAQMAYLVSGNFQAVVDFSFMPSIATSTRIDMLRITVFIINIANDVKPFALKGVFDTSLGENTSAHFSTAARKNINSEIQFQSMEEELWVRSSNKDAAIQFLLGGKQISTIESVTLATRDKLDSVTWIPSVQTSKSFNSVTSYNDSAVGINWPVTYLDVCRTATYGFYISVATGGNNPAGKQFLADLEEGRTALGIAAKNSESKTAEAPKPVSLTEEEVASVTPNVLNKIPSSSKEAFVKTQEIKESQLDPEYIQGLLDRIAMLKEDESMDQTELTSLNEELDSILKKLGDDR